MMINPSPHARSVRFKPPGATLLLLSALAVFFAAIAAFASPAHADVLRVTNKKDSGAGSLRAAVENAAPSRDTIVFSPRVRGTITLTSGNLDIDKNLTIRGPGADRLTISGNNSDNVLYISRGKTVKMSGLTITKGSNSLSGGGVRNWGNLTLIRSVVSGNSTDNSGGGIENRNVLRLIESTVSGNFADNRGGGINNSGTLITLHSTISGNRAAYGGGIYTGTSNPEKTIIANSTISGNSISSASGAGGGVYNSYGLTAIRNTTITNNTAPTGGPVFSNDYSNVSTRIFSTIIVDNPGGFASTATIISQGYNLVGSANVANAFNKRGDQTGVGANHGLKPLAYNGSLTKTHALQPNSPAINTGSPNCPAPATDQRRVKRAQGDRCDKGAFEARPDRDLAPKGCTIFGTDGTDVLVGTRGADIICGLRGNDIIRGASGNDTLKGGAGNDTIYGGTGADKLYGHTGVDRLFGQGGNDFLHVRDNKPRDVANGGAGNDRCAADRGDRRVSCER